jgi:hypothetical protein
VSGRRQRPAVDSKAAVVSIGTRRPDYSSLACGQVAAARRHLTLDHAAFARLLEDMLGWDILPEHIAAWEDDVTPPGDVLLACSVAAQGASGLAVPLLTAPPPGFPADALAGSWVTCYQFSHAGRPHAHADIAHVTAESGSRILAVNQPPEPRSEGRSRPFRNEIDAELGGRHLIGGWRNTSDTRYRGALELAVLPGEIVMQGYYTGVGSDIEVSTGFWKWVRLDPDSIPDIGLAGVTLRDPAALYDLVMSHPQIDVPLTLADVTEEP